LITENKLMMMTEQDSILWFVAATWVMIHELHCISSSRKLMDVSEYQRTYKYSTLLLIGLWWISTFVCTQFIKSLLLCDTWHCFLAVSLSHLDLSWKN